jgi:hypothetical protein
MYFEGPKGTPYHTLLDEDYVNGTVLFRGCFMNFLALKM